MPSAFRQQPVWINATCDNGGTLEGLSRYQEVMTKLANEAERYGSIDTYARSLALLGNRRERELAELKLHLAMFFLLEQAIATKDTIPTNSYRQRFSKPDQIDVRYMTWLAQLFDDKGKFSDRVRIVSWNYDLQLEHALALYLDLDGAHQVHDSAIGGVYPDPVDPNAHQASPLIVHLNGIAGQAVFRDSRTALYQGLGKTDPDEYIQRLFTLYVDYDKREQHMLRAMRDTFQFAWERGDVAQRGIQIAANQFAKAEILVIVGYSFPPFNRTIDIELMNAFLPNQNARNSKRIYVQSPSLSEETFRHMFLGLQKDPGVKADSSVNQFYLPPELFI